MSKKSAGKISLFIFILACFVIQGSAQQAFKVAVVDSQRTFEGSVAGKKAIAKLQEKEQKIKSELSNISNEILSLQKKLTRQQLTLTYETQQQITSKLDQLKIKYRRYEEDSAKEYQQLKFSLANKIRSEVLPIIENIAVEKGFSIVLDLSAHGVAYAHPNFDITKEVIRRYNASKTTEK